MYGRPSLPTLGYLPESQGGRRKKILHVFTAISYTYTHAHICQLVIRENSLSPFFKVYSDMKAFIFLLILFSVFSSRVEILVCQEPRGFQAWGIRRKCGLWKVRANPDITQLTYTPLTEAFMNKKCANYGQVYLQMWILVIVLTFAHILCRWPLKQVTYSFLHLLVNTFPQQKYFNLCRFMMNAITNF